VEPENDWLIEPLYEVELPEDQVVRRVLSSWRQRLDAVGICGSRFHNIKVFNDICREIVEQVGVRGSDQD